VSIVQYCPKRHKSPAVYAEKTTTGDLTFGGEK
jgi:hypothetical protein